MQGSCTGRPERLSPGPRVTLRRPFSQIPALFGAQPEDASGREELPDHLGAVPGRDQLILYAQGFHPFQRLARVL
ncbi:MAG: hypothetical protein JWN15_2859 [Firmicutes bacterium]|nr:hypothetical protein [Bacillota bacterium]